MPAKGKSTSEREADLVRPGVMPSKEVLLDPAGETEECLALSTSCSQGNDFYIILLKARTTAVFAERERTCFGKPRVIVRTTSTIHPRVRETEIGGGREPPGSGEPEPFPKRTILKVDLQGDLWESSEKGGGGWAL